MTLAVGDITSKLLDDVASVDFGEEESLYDSSMTADVACLYISHLNNYSVNWVNCAFSNV